MRPRLGEGEGYQPDHLTQNALTLARGRQTTAHIDACLHSSPRAAISLLPPPVITWPPPGQENRRTGLCGRTSSSGMAWVPHMHTHTAGFIPGRPFLPDPSKVFLPLASSPSNKPSPSLSFRPEDLGSGAEADSFPSLIGALGSPSSPFVFLDCWF